MLHVIYGPHFQRDVRAHIDYLRSHDEIDQILRLDEDLVELEELLIRFPQAGREISREGGESLRRLRIRRAPLLVWYAFEPDRDELTLVRLFHAKQMTPVPRLP